MREYSSTALAVISLLLCLAARAEEARVLQVMLQGTSAPELTALVEEAGGELTHHLPIINAIGAKLYPQQLETVLQSPLITRYVDDLSPTERPEGTPEDEDEEEEACKVRGHIELDFTQRGIRWGLFNKRDEPAAMERLTLAWPQAYGRAERVMVGDNRIDPGLFAEYTDGSLSVEFPKARRPVVEQQSVLRVDFSGPLPQPVRQHDFDIEVAFVGGCSDELVPGYENNHGDFYYNTVAGIDALHLEGVTGAGVTVAVVDSGLWEHDALVNDTRGKRRLAGRYDALTDTEDREVLDESGHGTHMASIIANSDQTIRDGVPDDTYKGVAPDATLVAVKVLDREGLAHVLEIVRAIQWVVDHREAYDIRIMNLSFAQTPRWPFWDDPVNQAVEVAWASGIAVVAAAGNEGPDAGTVGSPGNLPRIITVGAVTDSWTPETRDDDYIPDFSSRGPTPTGHVKPDIVALGGHMTGLIRPDSSLALEQPEDILRTGEFVSTGSSQASALVSGLLALLLQLEPDLTPDELKCKLISSAEPAINRDGRLAYSPFQQGYGYVSATRAVTLGQRGCDLPFTGQISGYADLDRLLGPAEVADDGGAVLPGLEAAVSDKPSEKGLSFTRKWGVKDHIERLEPGLDGAGESDTVFDWQAVYVAEKAAIERLGRQGAAGQGAAEAQ